MADLSLLQNFIVDTVGNLETMENNLVKLETEPDNRDLINNMLTSIQTIRANLGYAIGDLSPVPLEKKSRMICTNLVYSNLSPLPWGN
ncbi:hypothetical protein QUF90_20780 [Desulfococcaceae bacterium HSG9]|nr:hypothetical protein [Desulfococcaceae bacterium HSG9]